MEKKPSGIEKRRPARYSSFQQLRCFACRYSSWTASALAKKVEEGKANLEEIEAYALGSSEPKTSSGKQDSGLEMGDEP